MATKTTVKKTQAKEKKTLAELRADLLVARKSLYDGTLQNPHSLRSIRKEIARAMTAENSQTDSAKEQKGEK